jgi:hypothetical protein
MTDIIKNCIICASGFALIGCFITINKIEHNHKIYFKNIILETQLSRLEEQNNQLVNKIDSLQEKIIIIKNVLVDKKYIWIQQNELLEKINNSLPTDLYKTDLYKTNLSNSNSYSKSNSSNSLNSSIKLEDNYTEDKSIGQENTTKDIIEESPIFNSDEEIINDCYDLIPTSNVKKVTGIKSWFY